MVQLMPLPPVISCFVKIQISLTFLVQAYPGCLLEEAIKWVSVCLVASKMKKCKSINTAEAKTE